jgi:hypothetical protein
MAHHHHAQKHPQTGEREFRDFKVHSIAPATPDFHHSSEEVDRQKEDAQSHEKRKSIFDHQIAGFPWSFVLVMAVIAIGFLGLVLKVAGVF